MANARLDRTSGWLIAVVGVLLLSAHVSFKDYPSSDEVDDVWGFFEEPVAWTDRYAPDFEGVFLSGEHFKLSEHIGDKVIVLNFFATWCGPCKEEMPELEAYWKRQLSEPFLLVGIDAEESHEVVSAFVAEYGLTFPVLIDDDGSIRRKYGVRSYPITVLIGADGKVKVYQQGIVRNADVAFGPSVREAAEVIARGEGVSGDDYLQALAAQPAMADHGDNHQKDGEKTGLDKLPERARLIAGKMDCPCGCDDKVAECSCKTAKAIVTALAERDLSDKTDVEVIEELNKEFCVQDD